MAASPISDLLARYVNMRAPDASVRDAVAMAVTEEVGITVDAEHIRVTNAVAHVNTHPAVKSAIQQQHDSIIARVQRHLGSTTVTEIR